MLNALSAQMDKQNELGVKLSETMTRLPNLMENVEKALDRAAKPDERTAATVREFQSTMDRIHASMGEMVSTSQAQADAAVARHREVNEGVLRLDIFGIREEGAIDGELVAPLRPSVPALEPGKTYLLEVVVRTVKMGHEFTQGTADSNQIWLDVAAEHGGETIGRSGGMEPGDGSVDPWSHFLNAFVLDRDGYRVARRNAEDIFTPLYNHQIPPGAADVVHFAFTAPPGRPDPVTVEMQLKAHVAGLRVSEVPVRYRPRIGRSKITGTLSGTLRAGVKILGWIFGWRMRLWIRGMPRYEAGPAAGPKTNQSE